MVKAKAKTKRYNQCKKRTKKSIKKNYCKRGGNKNEAQNVANMSDKWNSSKIAIQQLLGDNLVNDTSGMQKYLSKVCPNSGDCLAFGPTSAVVKEYFDNFTTFRYLEPQSTVVLSSGANGSVNDLTYKRGKYTAHALLKTSIREESDNTLFEAFVGYNFINIQNMYFPCFVETYGAFKGDKSIKIPIPVTSEYVKLSCFQNKLNGNLVQHIQNATSMNTVIYHLEQEMKKFPYYKTYYLTILWQLMYQIYAVLDGLKNEYTHYDLHTENVLLYPIPNGKKVELKYYAKNGDLEYSFQTRYIVKIIDYGRCYTPLNQQYYDKVCETLMCGPTKDNICGITKGYQWFNGDAALDKEFFYITSLKRNVSHDVRLADEINNTFIHSRLTSINPNENVLGNIVYKKYGIKEHEDISNDDKIYNVTDMHHKLLRDLTFSPVIDIDAPMVASIDIYLDKSKPLQYNPIETPQSIYPMAQPIGGTSTNLLRFFGIDNPIF